jgi:hypothetical protein
MREFRVSSLGFRANLVLAFCLAFAASARGAAPRSFTVRSLALKGKLVEAAVVKGPKDGPRTIVFVVLEEWKGGKRRRIFPYSLPGLEPGAPLAVPGDAVLFDVAEVRKGGGEELVFLHPDGVTAWSMGGAGGPITRAKLVEAKTFFDAPQIDDLPRYRFCVDLSGDGAADLLIPQHYGYLAALREGDAFPKLRTLSLQGKNKMVRLTHEVFQLNFAAQRCTLPVLKAVDFNGDGRPDLLGLSNKELVGFLAREKEGLPVRPSCRMSLPFMVPSVEEPEEDVFEGKRVYVEEIDGDGRVDLVAVRTQGKVGLFSSIRTRFELFLGRPDAFYARLPDRVLTVPGVATRPEFLDLDGDGKRELLTPALRTDILAGIKTAALKKVTITHTIFDGGKDGLWKASPAFSESTSLSIQRIEEGRSVPGAAFAGDFDADGRKDRLVFDEDEVRIHPGVPGSRFEFADEPRWTLKVEYSNDFRVEDMNGDGASDILFFHHDRAVIVLSKP